VLRALDCTVTISFRCTLYCGCFDLFCNVWECVCVDFVICNVREFWEYVYLYLLCFVLFVLCFCIVSFMCIYSYLSCLYWCKDYCQRVKTQLL
jgi:hypothetical protein